MMAAHDAFRKELLGAMRPAIITLALSNLAYKLLFSR